MSKRWEKREPLWRPRSGEVAMAHFQNYVTDRHSLTFSSHAELHKWSLENLNDFWGAVADFTDILWLTPYTKAYSNPPVGMMRGAKWFKGGSLNYCHNLLPDREKEHFIASYAEGRDTTYLTSLELKEKTLSLASQLKSLGIEKGDVVSGVLCNTEETIIAMLATTFLGAIWSSCSPDFGEKAIMDRLGQIKPKVLFFSARYTYCGREFFLAPKIGSCCRKLPDLVTLVVVDHLQATSEKPHSFRQLQEMLPLAVLPFPDLCSKAHANLKPTPVSFSDPLFIMFSSGTTGRPKCIVHSVGGTLLQHKKELSLHTNLSSDSKLMYFTTCGWMMWNWMVSSISLDCSLVLYDGSPVAPKIDRLWQIIDVEEVTAFGTSPKFLASNMQQGVVPKNILKKRSLRTLLSTGSPLSDEQFQWVYKNCGSDLHLASISGGTDIISCFMLGVPTLPVFSGEIQYPGLGMACEVWNKDGQRVWDQPGELVCTKPFPSMPVCFWDDKNDEKYRQAYFDYYHPGFGEVWRHGDLVSQSTNFGFRVYGRSDATLNPGGVRIGTAEIYSVLENMDFIEDSLAATKEVAGEAHIALFIKCKIPVSELQIKQIKGKLRAENSPRHVPRWIVAVSDVPYTRSGKKVEIAITKIINGLPIDNQDALVDANVLTEYAQFADFKVLDHANLNKDA